METAASTDAKLFENEPATYDEVSMQQSMLFSDSLKDLKNLRKQLYSAAEYFELSYSNGDQKQIVVNTLKNYAIKALVNTVDHLGSVTYKVNDLLGEKVDEVSETELRVSCIEQEDIANHFVMETMASTDSKSFENEPATYDEVSMQQRMIFSDNLKDLKNIRKQLYTAAEYFEMSYSNDDQKHIVVNTLKDYAIKALVNTVDHLGTVTYKVNDLLDEKVNEVSETEFRVSCIEQRLRTCQEYIDREGLSQQSLVINTPKYHKRFILPVGETMHGTIRTKSKYQGCNIDNGGDEWHQFRNAIRETPPPTVVSKGRSASPKLAQQSGNFSFSSSLPKKYPEKRSSSPYRFPLVRTTSLSSKPTTTKTSQPSTPNRSRSTTPNPSLGRQTTYISEPRKSSSMKILVGKESLKDIDQVPGKSKRLLKALLSRRKSKKDDTLYTYLDEY